MKNEQETSISKSSSRNPCYIDQPVDCPNEGHWGIQITIRRTKYVTTIIVCDEHKHLAD